MTIELMKYQRLISFKLLAIKVLTYSGLDIFIMHVTIFSLIKVPESFGNSSTYKTFLRIKLKDIGYG